MVLPAQGASASPTADDVGDQSEAADKPGDAAEAAAGEAAGDERVF
jgi:hypothetical protein